MKKYDILNFVRWGKELGSIDSDVESLNMETFRVHANRFLILNDFTLFMKFYVDQQVLSITPLLRFEMSCY